jgi:ABC-type glutathione transport system ATPase component
VGATIAGTEILSDISVVVERGQSVGLVGETGSGKTMACRLMSGMIGHVGGAVVRGKIQFEGRDVTQLSEKGWRQLRGSRIGYIAQNSTSNATKHFHGQTNINFSKWSRWHDPGSWGPPIHTSSLEVCANVLQ